MKIVLTLLILFLNYPVHSLHQKRVLSESEIVKIAEDFVREQGYTNEPPIADKSKWSPDSVWGTPSDEEMTERRNQIEKGAYGIVSKSSRTIPWDWVVVFRYNPKYEPFRKIDPDYEEMTKKQGMAVCLDKYGDRVRKVHQDIYLSDKSIKVLEQ